MSDSSDDGSGVPTTTTKLAQDVVTALEENKRAPNSDSSSDESQLAPDSKPAKGPSTTRKKKRKRLRPILDSSSTTIKEDEPCLSAGSSLLTQVSTDYRHKLRKAEKETFVKKSRLEIDDRDRDEAQKRSRARAIVSSDSSSSSEEEDETKGKLPPNKIAAAKKPKPNSSNDDDLTLSPNGRENGNLTPPSPRRLHPSPPRFQPTPKSLTSQHFNPDVLSSLAEIQKVRRNLAEDRLKCRRSDSFGAASASSATMADSFYRSLEEKDAASGLKVKVLSLKSGLLRRIQMTAKDTFSVVYALMASTEGVDVDQVRLTLRDSTTVVKPGDTYGDHNLTICDIVECHVMVKDPAKESASASATATASSEIAEKTAHEISLNIQSRDSRTGQFTTVKISKKAALKALMEQYANSQDLPLEKLKFSFDGDKIDPDSTPEDLDMEDDDCVDVVVIGGGGGVVGGGGAAVGGGADGGVGTVGGGAADGGVGAAAVGGAVNGDDAVGTSTTKEAPPPPPNSSAVENANPPPPPKEITLHFQSLNLNARRIVSMKISPTAPLKSLMEKYAVEAGITLDKLKFSCFDEKLVPDWTPEMNDLEDEDCVDVSILN